ncbi:hypothetical protein [Sinorhizobium medicae]|uniref:hypothetical protein n=1 Tax=Sinorhizobium medicae TaxID=110321 RepID=UPI002AF6B407|nr:hypothetical protein [Sinorhizobium medicae]WQO60923.1 hypothetical protein U8C35_23610 [Sinorhizobium medicae]
MTPALRMIERPSRVVGVALLSKFIVHWKDMRTADLDLLSHFPSGCDHHPKRASLEDVGSLNVVSYFLNEGVLLTSGPDKPGSKPLRMMNPKVQGRSAQIYSGVNEAFT